ncbi:hypothetical protein PMAYCL1PPCAC_25035 [Pristionchus mayeri]|uniref:Uncharacterized protein n=1 Tax=Pristionchus mayeri TaxID=1317129 RepID=A0AAN5I8B4_9BILA|nr:hypothetical protein PMAYCL1PPCAC_25035 [Pristionchus mayeri]
MPRLLLSIFLIAIIFVTSVGGGLLWSDSHEACVHYGNFNSTWRCSKTGIFAYYTCCADSYECCFHLQGWVILLIACILISLLISCICIAIGFIRRRK